MLLLAKANSFMLLRNHSLKSTSIGKVNETSDKFLTSSKQVISTVDNLLSSWNTLVMDRKEEAKSLSEVAKALADIVAAAESKDEEKKYEAGGMASLAKMMDEFLAEQSVLGLYTVS
jgi:hypothetical protein